MIPMATKQPRQNPDHVLAGDAPGGIPQIVLTQFLIIGTIVATYIGLWMVLDDSAMLPGTKPQEPRPIAMPWGYNHEVAWTSELTDLRASEEKKLTGGGANGGSDAAAFRIPIEKAMALVVQRGLPTKVMPQFQAQIDLARQTTESNGGQTEWLSTDRDPVWANGRKAMAAPAGAAVAKGAPAAHGYAAPAHGVAPVHH
jgi:hypothetical protein